MAFTFDLSIEDKPKRPKAKSAKPRGYNPPGARTRNEPPRVFTREEINDEPYTYMKPGAVVPPDSIELRRKVADALLDISLAHEAFHNSLKAFHALGQLPEAIIRDMPLKQKRYLKIWKKGR